jgi:hypothetical protein
MAQALVELVRLSPDSALIAVCEHDGERFTVHEILAEAGGAKASFVLDGVLPFIPARLIDGNQLREPGRVSGDLRGAYAALRSRLSKLEIRRSAAFLGLQLAADAGLSLSLAIPELPGEPSSQGPVGLSAAVDVTATAGTLRGRVAFQIEVTAAGPKIEGAFGWPTFGFSFPKLDFGSLSLPDLRLTLPDMPAWLPGSKIVWVSRPVLRLDATAGLSLFIDDGSNPGQPVAAAIEIEGGPLFAINTFQVMGRVDALTVTVQVSVSPVTTSIPDGQKSLGPVTVAWTNVQADASLASQVLRVTTRVPSLVVQGPTSLIEVSFEYVYQYDLVSGAASRDLQGFTVVQPTGGQIAQVLMRELRGLSRIIVAIDLPGTGPVDPVVRALGELVIHIMKWLSAGAGTALQGLVGLGRGIADLGERVFDALGKIDAAGAGILLEVRWDVVRGEIKQIILSRTGAGMPASEISKGELTVAFAGASGPFLVFDLVEKWVAVAVAPSAGVFEASLSTDLWLASESGHSPARSNDADPLLTVKATVRPPATGQALSPVAIAMLQDGQPRFFRSLGEGASETIAGGVSIASPFVPRPLSIDIDFDIKLNEDKIAAIFPTGKGSAIGSNAPTVRILKWHQVSAQGSARQFDLELEVDPRLKGRKLYPTIRATLDLARLTLQFDSADIPINVTDPIDVFGARLSLDPPEDGLILRLSEAPSVRLGKNTRAVLAFEQIGDGKDALAFEAVGEEGFSLGAGGLDLVARVVDHPIRLRGLDTPFRFTSGDLRVERSRLLSAAIVGSGALPPALLGEAKIDVGIQIGQDENTKALVIKSATARLERAGEPLICEGTRFHFELTHVGLGFKLIDSQVHFYGEITGSATFRPNPGELAGGLLARLPEAKINLDRAPIAGDGRALSKAINFQVPVDPPARANLFNLFDFELRGVGFHPSYDGWRDNPPALSLSGQVRFTDAFDVIEPSFEFHKMWITRPESGKTLPRIRLDGLGVGLRIGAMGEFAATAVAVDGSLPSLYAPDVLPANVTAHGFLASGRLMLKGWAAMSGAAGFLELERSEEPGKRRLTFFVYAQQEQLAEPIPTPIGTLYLREVGFGLGYRFTLAGLAQTDAVSDPRDLIKILDPISKRQGDLASFPAWQPEIEGDRITLAMRALFTVTTASSPTVYNAEQEKELDNPVLFDVIAALRSDLTFLLSVRAWLAVNYADWRSAKNDWREKPLLRGYLYISAPKKTFLGRFISDPSGHIGEHPKLPEPLIKALTNIQFSSTLYITPGLYHQEFGWPYELKFNLGKPEDKFYANLSGGMVTRIEDGAILNGVAFAARGHVKVGGRGGGSVGASAEATAEFSLDSKFIAYISAQRPVESLFYGRMQLAISLEFTIRFWVNLQFFKAEASWSERVDVEVDLEVAVGPRGLAAHARASISIRRFGRGLRLGVSVGMNEGMLSDARARVERFMALGLGATVPDPASGLAPLPEPARKARAGAGDDALENLADRRDTLPLPETEDTGSQQPVGPPVTGDNITGCDFWAIVIPVPGRNDRAVLQLVPRDNDVVQKLTLFETRPHGDFFVSPYPVAEKDHIVDGHEYVFDAPDDILRELEFASGQRTKKPDWGRQIDARSGGTVGDLVSAGFLSPVSGRFTQPKASLPDDATPKEKADTLGCLEARGSLIGLVCDRAHQLAQALTQDRDVAAPDKIDPRWFGLTFVIGKDGVALTDTLKKLFPLTNRGPRPAAFTIAKSDDTTENIPSPHQVALFNPVERWFENAQPQLSNPLAFVKNRVIWLDWDLEPTWGASETRFDDPESHLLHYVVQRHIQVGDDLRRQFHTSWFAKRGEVADLVETEQGETFQALDRLADLPDDLRQALLFFESYRDDQDVSAAQHHEYRKHYEAWQAAFPAGMAIRLIYSVIAVDNGNTRTIPSVPFSFELDAPPVPRALPLAKSSIEFSYVPVRGKTFAFPKAGTELPAKLSMFLQLAPHPDGVKKSAQQGDQVDPDDISILPDIELYFDVDEGERSGIYGADLLDAQRHYKKLIDAKSAPTATLKRSQQGADTVPVYVYIVDPDRPDPALQPETFYCKSEDLRKLAVRPGNPAALPSTQIFARLNTANVLLRRASQWTMCDLKLRIARHPDDGADIRLDNQHDDFIAPVAEFEMPRLRDTRLLGSGSLDAQKGLLHRKVPRPGSTWKDKSYILQTDPDNRSAIRLSWEARPSILCDGSAASADLIGGFDVFTASRDREPPQNQRLTAGELARLARPLGRVLVKPRALLSSEPALVEDFSKLQVFYPSEAQRSKGKGWYSAAESRLIWPERTQRLALCLIPDEGLIGEIFGSGRPSKFAIRFHQFKGETTSSKPYAPLVLKAVHDLHPDDRLSAPDEEGWHRVQIELTKPAHLRGLLQQLNRKSVRDDDRPDRGLLQISYSSGGKPRLAEIRIGLESELHPLLADMLDLLRYDAGSFETGDGYRRFEPILEGAPAPQEGVVQNNDTTPARGKLSVAQLFSDTAPERDKAGWSALRQLGLAAGFRLWDTETDDWMNPFDDSEQFNWAWEHAVKRNFDEVWSFGAPFLEQFFDPEELYVLGGEDRVNYPRSRDPKGLPLLQLALRPMVDRLQQAASPNLEQNIFYVEIKPQAPATVTAAQIKTAFQCDVLIEFRTGETGYYSGRGVWVGEALAGSAGFQPVAEYTLSPAAEKGPTIARVVLPDQRLVSRDIVPNLKASFKTPDLPVTHITWSPGDPTGEEPNVNPYKVFDALPTAIIDRMEKASDFKDGHQQLRTLANNRFGGWTYSVDETAAIQSWQQRFYDHGLGSRLGGDDYMHFRSMGAAVATIDAPASLRRAPDERGRISVLFLDNSGLGSWRRFYVRPFGRYDHLAEASGWPCADPNLLTQADFAGSLLSNPWIDVTLDRTLDVAKPVLLASAYARDAKALVAVVAHSDEQVLAGANIPQAGARQIGSSDIGWRHELGAAPHEWAKGFLPNVPPVPPLKAKRLDPLETSRVLEWIIQQGTPPEKSGRPAAAGAGLPDLWRGADVVAAYDLPYLFDYEILLAHGAGVAISSPTRSALPSPRPMDEISWSPDATLHREKQEVVIEFPLARYLDCMEQGSRDAWYDPDHESAALFELPDPAIIYRFQMTSAAGDIRSPEFDLEADAHQAEYGVTVTGRTFKLKKLEPPRKVGRQWSVRLTLESMTTETAGDIRLEAIPVRNTRAMNLVGIRNLP